MEGIQQRCIAAGIQSIILSGTGENGVMSQQQKIVQFQKQRQMLDPGPSAMNQANRNIFQTSFCFTRAEVGLLGKETIDQERDV